jgi:26S proteasome regulatory subunit N7
MADEVVLPYPNIQLPQAAFILSQPNLSHLHAQAKKELLEGIENDGKPRSHP